MTKIFTGVVVSDKMTKTIVVDVQRRMQHPRFRKIIKAHKKFKVHVDEDGLVKVGDVVRIIKTRPISKDKHFVLFTGKETIVKVEKKPEVKAEAQVKVAAKPAATKKAAAPKKTVATKPAAKKTAVKKVKVAKK